MGRVADPLRAMGARHRARRTATRRSRSSPARLARHDVPAARRLGAGQERRPARRASSPRARRPSSSPSPTRDHTERMLGLSALDDRRRAARRRSTGGLRPRGRPARRRPARRLGGGLLPRRRQRRRGGRAPDERRRPQPDARGRRRRRCARWAPTSDASNERERGGEPLADAPRRRATGRPHGRRDRRATLVPNLIDEIPVLAVAAAFAQGRTVIRDAAELRVKESDRIAATAAFLRAMGADVERAPRRARDRRRRARSAARRSTRAATTASRWPPPSRPSARRARRRSTAPRRRPSRSPASGTPSRASLRGRSNAAEQGFPPSSQPPLWAVLKGWKRSRQSQWHRFSPCVATASPGSLLYPPVMRPDLDLRPTSPRVRRLRRAANRSGLPCPE